jgi:glycosyltransferase involved in cell wall biosynthesis
MRIGIDCHNLEEKRTGTGRYLMNLLKYWAKENAEIVLYFKNQIPDDIPDSKNFQKKVLKNGSNFWFEHILLPRAIKKDGVEIFFSPSYILPIRMPKGVKTAVAIHDISYEAHPEWYSWQNRILLRWISKKSAERADMIFACSQFTKNEILKHYKIDEKKIFVIPLAADEDFTPYHSLEGAEYGIKNKFIFYAGAIFQRRFILETIEAFKKIAARLPEYQFLISGPNYTQPFIDIDNLIKKANQDIGREAVLYIDYVKDKDLVNLYNGAELFIWLSSYEGFGLPPLEAMACGTPVITTKMASLPETVGDAAMYVEDPRNIDEVVHAISKVLNNEKTRNWLIEKGLKQSQKFSWRKTAEETFKLLINYAK